MSAAPEIEFDHASVAQRMRDVREAARSVSEGFSREYMRECIDNHRFPQEAWEALGEYGLLGITIPDEKANEFETVRDALNYIQTQVKQ